MSQSPAERAVSSLGYVPVTEVLGSDDPPADLAWLAELVVVFDGPRLLVTSPNGAVGRPTGFHAALDAQQRWWAVSITRTGTAAYAWREGPFGHIEAVAAALLRLALATDWGGLSHRLPISAERIQRALEHHPGNPCGSPDEEAAINSRLSAAVERFLAEHARYGGWRFHGRPDATDPRGYAGPLYWKEEDVRFRLALELEREFPGAVHLDALLTDATAVHWDPAVDGVRQFADIHVGDFRAFRDGPDARERFRRTPAVFLAEVKFLAKGRRGDQLARELEAIRSDAARLARHLDTGRTQRAAVVVVADDDQLAKAFAEHGPFPDWQHAVELIHARPQSPLLDPDRPGLPFPWGIRTRADARLVAGAAPG